MKSLARKSIVEAAGQLFERCGYRRSTGQVFGLMYMSNSPLTLDDLGNQLGISKGSVSNATRELLVMSVIKPVWIPGERKDYFEVQPDVVDIIRKNLGNLVDRRIRDFALMLTTVDAELDSDRKQGMLMREEFEKCRERVTSLRKLQQGLEDLAPLVREHLK